MVSGDTGPIHIAGAMAVPIVALFGPTDAGRNGPWHPDDIALSRYDSCACHYERQCRRPDADWCLGTITTEAVIEAIDRRLSAAPPDNPEGR
jgi:ADP-heptose:LPS heptosyltransferase